MSSYQRGFLETVYKECNEHAREQPKRRDSIITIYLAVYAAFIGLITSSVQLSPDLTFGLVVIMYVLGFMCSLTVINFRCWAIEYVSCAQAIAAVLIDESSYSPQTLTKELWKKIKRNPTRSKSFFGRTENIIVLSFVVITATPIIVLVKEIVLLDSAFLAVLLILFIVLYIILFTVVMHRKIKEADSGELISKKRAKFPPWIINFDFSAVDIKNKD